MGEEAEPSKAAEEAEDDQAGAAAMDVEEGEGRGLRWTGLACGNGTAEGFPAAATLHLLHIRAKLSFSISVRHC